MDLLVYLLIFSVVIISLIQAYLDLFPRAKLYQEVCLKRANKKINFFFTNKRLSCLKMLKDAYPEYRDKIEKHIVLDRTLKYIGIGAIAAIVLLVLVGVIPYEGSVEHFKGTSRQSITITKTEGNKTSVKTYKNLQEFVK